MKSPNVYLPLAAAILTPALVVPAAAQQQVTFKGMFQGNDTVSPGPFPPQQCSVQPPRELAPTWVNAHSPRNSRERGVATA